MPRLDPPPGPTTLLMADIQGSVAMWEADAGSMRDAIERLDEMVEEIVTASRGTRPLEQGEGDSFIASFSSAADATACALDLQRAIHAESWPGGFELRVRMALHTGEVEVRDDGRYAGHALNRCARLRSLAHGGQTLVAGTTADLVADRLPDGSSLKDLGEHRLRDLTRPERVYQLCHVELPGSFPPPVSPSTIPNNLPLQLTSFVGREREMHELKEQLGHTRILTLSGTGGAGKTRLALELGADLVDRFPDGVWWVDLAPLTDPAAVPRAIAGVLGLWNVSDRDVVETIVETLRERRTLILLDNCEHLVTACADLAAALLQTCPGVVVVATSREPLGVHGEVTYRVPSLGVPEENDDPVAVEHYASIRLFADRARIVRPNFRLTAQDRDAVTSICRRLDGIPLAIELAAARVRVLTPTQIADGLSQRFRLLSGGSRTAMPRQRTLEASVDWSHRLLTENEQRLLARLSVFAGRFSLDAAEDVCSGEPIDRYQVLDLLTSLVDKSLVQVDEDGREARYRLLETIRHYARERLANLEEVETVRLRHLRYYAAMAAAIERELRKEGVRRLLDAVEPQIENMSTAMAWAFEAGHTEEGLQIALFWVFQGRYLEVAGYLDVALAAIRDDPSQGASRALTAVVLAGCPGDWTTALRLAEEAVTIARDEDDRRTLCRALSWYGWAHYNLDPPKARAPLEEGVAIAREIEDTGSLTVLLGRLGLVEAVIGMPDEGLQRFADVSRWLDPHRDPLGRTYIEVCRAGALMLAGRYREAADVARSAAAMSHELGDLAFLGWSEYYASIAALNTGHYDDAEAHAEHGVGVARESGERLIETLCIGQLGAVSLARADLASALERLEASLDGLRRYPQQSGLATTLLSLARARRAAGDIAGAEAHRAEASEIAERYGLAGARAASLLSRATLSADDDPVGSEQLAHQALGIFREMNHEPGIADALECVASIAARSEAFATSSRLLAAIEGFRERTGYPRQPIDAAAYEKLVATLNAALGDDGFADAWQQGAAMSLGEVVGYASRGRGERRRPSTGWASLTPTELEVTRLVARGLTNRDIAERMFVSRSTVKVHLSHIFAKLGIAGRAELAAEAVRRDI